jgi:uncharacterized protein (DUF362 family)
LAVTTHEMDSGQRKAPRPTAKVAVLRTRPETVLEDYGRLLDLAEAAEGLRPDEDLILKLNLSWTKYFPACSSQPWQLEGVVRKLLEMGHPAERLLPVENKTVVTHPWKGARNNRWLPVLDRYGLRFRALPEEKWIRFDFGSPFLKLHEIFPEGIEIPEMYVGRPVLHLPTVKTHGHSVTTGAVKNSFGGLLKEVRHYCHKYMHEVLVDLLYMQKELHPRVFAVMDGTVCGDGAGPRTMIPRINNYILASWDSVALDAVAARLMGFDPMEIGYLRMATERGLGEARMERIEIAGEDIEGVDFGFTTRRSFVIWGDQMLRRGPLRFLEKVALHGPLMGWAPLASNIYHDFFWYPIIGRKIIRSFRRTEWGKLFESY